MDNIDLEELIKITDEHRVSVHIIEKLYPKLYEPIMNLSITGVPARVYFYWKKSGLVDNISGVNNEKGWVKINLIEYLWIKVVVILRDYGVSFEKIKETKELMFSNIFELLSKDKDDFITYLNENNKLDNKNIVKLEKVLDIAKHEMNSSPEEFNIYHTLIGNLIIEMLINNDNGYITLKKEKNEFMIDYFSMKSSSEFDTFFKDFFEIPCLFIPMKCILKDFLEDLNTEKIIEKISLLNLKEMKVIKAIRNKDFKEIIIRQDEKNNSIIIEIEKDYNVLDEKAKQIKKILGLNEYSEITVKYRNDKNLYIKNKTRI